jgi:DNA-binding MarR family transcriptional regulator
MQLAKGVDAASTDSPSTDAVDALGEAVVGLVHAFSHAARPPGHALPAEELTRLLAVAERRLGWLAAQRGVSQSVVSRQVGELEARGLVVRRCDPADGRAGLVRLTPAGRELLDDVARTRRRWLRDALRQCSAEDVRAAVRVVRALTAALGRRSTLTTPQATPAAAAEGQS